jgi:hypothetical protein
MDHWYIAPLLTFGPILAGLFGHWAGRQIGQPKTQLAQTALALGEIGVQEASSALLAKSDPTLVPVLAQMITLATGVPVAAAPAANPAIPGMPAPGGVAPIQIITTGPVTPAAAATPGAGITQ